MKHLKPKYSIFSIGGLLIFLLSTQLLKSQNDTIFSREDTIPCNIRELGLKTITYLIPGTTSPVFIIHYSNVNAYRIAGRDKVIFSPGSNFREQSEKWLAKNALIVKTSPLAPLNNHFTLGVEQSLSQLVSLEFEGAYIDSKAFIQTNRYNHGFRNMAGLPASFNGGYIRPSFKIKKLDYRSQYRINSYYLRLDAAISTIKYYDVRIDNSKNLSSDIILKSKGVLLSSGYQVCWRTGFVFEMFFGVGYSDFQYDLANKNVSPINFGYEGIKEYLSNAAPFYYCFNRQGASGLSYSFGIRLGYRIADK